MKFVSTHLYTSIFFRRATLNKSKVLCPLRTWRNDPDKDSSTFRPISAPLITRNLGPKHITNKIILSWAHVRLSILGDPGATSRDDAILSGERQFWRESLFQGLKSPWALFLTKRVPEVSKSVPLIDQKIARKYRIVPTRSPWVSEDDVYHASLPIYNSDSFSIFYFVFVLLGSECLGRPLWVQHTGSKCHYWTTSPNKESNFCERLQRPWYSAVPCCRASRQWINLGRRFSNNWPHSTWLRTCFKEWTNERT